MKSILGIIASPRRLGNSELLVKEIARHLAFPHQLKMLRLSDFRIDTCRACYRCLFGEERCNIEDDLYKVLDPIVASDALIIAAPAYFLGPHSLLKRFIDRGLSFYAHIDQLWGKPAIATTVAGIPGREGHALLGVENFAKMLMADIKESRVLYGALPGEVFLDENNRVAARQLAESLFVPKREKTGPHCNICGSETFRFIDEKTVRCMLCSNTGNYQVESACLRLDIHSGEHELLLNREAAESHKRWLQGMKDRFIENKKALKKIVLDYRKDGEWIKA